MNGDPHGLQYKMHLKSHDDNKVVNVENFVVPKNIEWSRVNQLSLTFADLSKMIRKK